MVSVLEFKAERGLSHSEAEMLRMVFESELINTDSFTVIEKNELERVIDAQKDTLLGCVDGVCAVEIGRLLAADKVITGTVGQISDRFILSVKLISVETGRCLKAEHIQAETMSGLLDDLGILISRITSAEQGPAASISMLSAEDLIYIEGSTFQMGSVYGDSDEKPVQTITMSSFYIGKYEVTQKLYKDVMGFNPSANEKGVGDDYPVNTVSWFDAVRFCNLLSRREGLNSCYLITSDLVSCDFSANGYRLPTEAEWEYAASGGSESMGYRYAGGNDPDTVAWYAENSGNRTHPVGLKKANELGIHDMTGNVWEWCWDVYEESPAGEETIPWGRKKRTVV